jgi:hypothetical protein
VIDENNFGLVLNDRRAQLFRLSATHEVARIGAITPTRHLGHGYRARGGGELPEFLEVFRVDRRSQPEAHEYGALTRAWALKTLQGRPAKW